MGDGRELLCPACRSVLRRRTDELHCPSCSRVFPVVAGIPDLRLHGDEYLSLEADRSKARALASQRGSAESVVREYWRATPEVPAALAERYIHNVLDGPRRCESHLDEIGTTSGELLDVGCGPAGLLVTATRRGLVSVGVDIALRWLVVARRLLDDAGCDALLVAADGAILPFAPRSFDVVTCIETLEHATDQRGLLHSALRCARLDGVAYIVTANRHSILPDPTVGLWGLGYLPHGLATRYVAWRRHTRYQFMRPRSRSEMRAMLGPASSARIGAAALPSLDPKSSPATRVARQIYERARSHRLGDRALASVGPYLQLRVP
jgi:2-polyprenyl-3-methyl-5-hydroxy-6-metoxy-1,4-benzoquinol methylase